tara:strand:+ start:60 stop:470 length:411 start_codon:yes stop_codon:yes gene_type:complete
MLAIRRLTMKLTTARLKQLIKEELSNVVDEGLIDMTKAFGNKMGSMFSAEENEISSAISMMERVGVLPVDGDGMLMVLVSKLVRHFGEMLKDQNPDVETIYEMVEETIQMAQSMRMVKGITLSPVQIEGEIRKQIK